MSNRRVLGTGGGSAFSSGGTTNNILPKEDGSGGLKDSLVSDSGTALTYNSKVVPSWTTGGVTTNTVPKTSGTAGLLADSQIVDNGTSVIFPNGATANPGIVFTGQTGTGWSWGNELSIHNLKASTSGTLVASFSSSYGLGIYSSKGIAFSTSNSAGTHDAFLTQAAAATLQMGAANAAAPVAQTLQVQSATATNTDQAGGDWTLINSKGTGIGALPRTIIKGPLLGSTGTTVQTAAIREVLCYNKTGLANNTATALVQLALPSGSHGTVQFAYSVEVNDATDFQAETGMVSFASVNKAGVLTHGTPAKSGNVQVLSSAATLAITFTAVTNGSAVDLKITSNSSLTPTSTRVMLQVLNMSFKNDVTLQ
jgi:hypothetical protein